MSYTFDHGQALTDHQPRPPAAEQETSAGERKDNLAPRREGQALNSGARAEEGEAATATDSERPNATGETSSALSEKVGTEFTRHLKSRQLAARIVRARVLEGIAHDALAEVDEGLTTSNNVALWRGRAHLVKLLRELHHGV